MAYLIKLSNALGQAKWTPPLHAAIEMTAPTLYRPTDDSEDVTPLSGELTPISADGYDSDSAQSKAPICPTRINQLLKKIRCFRPLDASSKAAGSRFVFVLTLTILLTWAILGAVLGPSDVWQIVMQNASSIQCYVSDTLLMRQQFNNCSHFLKSIGELRSRNRSIINMSRSLTPAQREDFLSYQSPFESTKTAAEPTTKDVSKKVIDTFDLVCDFVAVAVGSLPALIIYIIGIGIWLGTGSLLSFNNLWQLDINTAVAVELTFTSMFLQNVRRRHAESLGKTLSSIRETDSELEWRLRSITGDLTPHQSFMIEPPETTRTERFIDIYAYIVGSGVGVALSITVVAIWLGVGHLLSWDSNWWLIIGTYTGLVGFVDGFVLRNVYMRQSDILNQHLQAVSEKDQDVFALLRLRMPVEISIADKKSLSFRISHKTIEICAHPLSVIGSLAVVVALIAVATGLLWSETGQLICNTPTMIVEGFLLLVLFQAHNMTIVERRGQFGAVLERRNISRRCVRDYKVRQESNNDVLRIEIESKD